MLLCEKYISIAGRNTEVECPRAKMSTLMNPRQMISISRPHELPVDGDYQWRGITMVQLQRYNYVNQSSIALLVSVDLHPLLRVMRHLIATMNIEYCY